MHNNLTMQLDIITPTKTVYSCKVKSVQLPGTKGNFEILKNHAAIVSTLEKGTIIIIDANGQKINLEINGGLVECKSNQISILTDSSFFI
jgi:F-type H+-transporting ATPase subunit epsilon